MNKALLLTGTLLAVVCALLGGWLPVADPDLPNVPNGYFASHQKGLFGPKFLFGTATAAAQIETASEHTWRGVLAKDGVVFNRTIEHELHRHEDAGHIARLGNAYRFSMAWDRLQQAAFAPFNESVVREYTDFLVTLREKNVHLM